MECKILPYIKDLLPKRIRFFLSFLRSLVYKIYFLIRYDKYLKYQIKIGNNERDNEQYRKAIEININEFTSNLLPSITVGNPKILDIACGSGYALDILEDNNLKAFGGDLNHKKLLIAKKSSHNVFRTDMHNLSIKNCSLDAILSIHSLEHSINAQKVVNEFMKALKSNGILYIIVPLDRASKGHPTGFTRKNLLSDLLKDFNIRYIHERKTREDELWVFCQKP